MNTGLHRYSCPIYHDSLLVELGTATTLNVAFNNHNKVLLLIMMSNNFIEIKGSVFKKFEKHNLFQVRHKTILKVQQLFGVLLVICISGDLR